MKAHSRKPRSSRTGGVPVQPAVPVPPPSTSFLLNSTPFLLVILGWAIVFFALVSLQDFNLSIKPYSTMKPNVVPLIVTWWMMAAGFAVLLAGLRFLPGPGAGADLGPGKARLLLGLIAGGSVFMILYRLHVPMSSYWDDWANNIVLTRYILDRGDARLLFQFGGREPFFPYLVTGFQYLLGEYPNVVVHRISSATVVLLTVWVAYLAGREMGSRWAGLIAASVVAFSKPLLLLNLMGLRVGALPLAVSLAVLFLLRVLRRPSPAHFVQWGLATAFGIHTYSAFRPYMMLVPVFLLLWVLKDRREWKDPLAWIAQLASLGLLTALFSGLMSATHPAFKAFENTCNTCLNNKSLALILFASVTGLAGLVSWTAARRGGAVKMAGLSLGLSLCCLLVYPISRQPEFNDRLPTMSVFYQESGATQDTLGFLAGKVVYVFQSLFWSATDRNDMAISCEPYYDLFTQGAVVLGLAGFLAWWGWRRFFLAVMAGIGTVVLMLSGDPHSGKVVSAVAPLAVLAAGAVDRLRSLWPGGSWKRWGLAAFLVVYAVFGFSIQFHRFHGVWAKATGPEILLSRNVHEYSTTHRVYLAGHERFFGMNTQFVLNEGLRFYYLKDENRIPVPPGGAVEDLMILFHEDVKDLEAEIRRCFPNAEWTRHRIFQNYGGIISPETYLWRVIIAGRDVPDDPKCQIYRVEESGGWMRRYYTGYFGWGKGGILRERALEDPLAVPTDEALEQERYKDYVNPNMVVMTGKIQVPEDGVYEWSLCPKNPAYLKVGGKRLFKERIPGDDVSIRKVRLKAGPCPVEIRVWLQQAAVMPLIHYRKKGDPDWKSLGDPGTSAVLPVQAGGA